VNNAKTKGLRNNRRGYRIWRTLKYFHLRFIRLRGRPEEIARGVALGVFAGAMPIVPFQTAFAVFLAILFKGSKIAAALGTWVSNPLNWYFLYFYSYKIGAEILGLRARPKAFQAVLTAIQEGESAWLIFKQMVGAGGEFMGAFLLGGLVLGTVFSIPAYFISLRMILSFRAYRARRQQARLCLKDDQ